ncbi:MAG: hypothetical protein KDB47_07010 [Mycobacterium sp.]|nr:hypothetical protein [Mycobacterium sp.]
MREMLVSPDGNAVAIRTDQTDPEGWNAWGVINALNGGHWSKTAELIGWTVLDATEEVIAAPQPDNPEYPTV